MLAGDAVDSVNTFIGTRDEGNTFPGASMPFGMAHSSPIGSHYSGWRYDDPIIRGFGHFFLSGAGCAQQGGLISILPTTGAVGPNFNHKEYGSPYTHDGEVGQPGYFRVQLTGYGGIAVETTATTRAGVERFTFPAAGPWNVLVNVGQANNKEPVFASGVRVVDDRTLTGYVVAQAFCGGGPYTTYFVTTFDRPFTTFGTWANAVAAPGSRESAGGHGLRGAWVTFEPGEDNQITAYTAISHVDFTGAERNFAAEVRDGEALLSFDVLRERARAAWSTELSTVDIETGSADDRTVFYTALYHVLLQPLTGNDVDGRYLGFDNRIHHADGWTYHEFWSLWDTYRAHNQLLALLRPGRTADIARSILAIHEQGGWLPRWAYANQETNTMTGDPVTPFLVDLWRFGALVGREEQAYAALWQNVTQVPAPDSPFEGRAGNPNYLTKGWVQHNPLFKLFFFTKGHDADPQHGASATLEYCVADGALSVMAEALGHKEDAEALRRRARNYRLLWDTRISDRGFTGFPRPRTKSGRWYRPLFKRYTPQGSSGFHEGTSWQYQWLVQQDVPGLVELLGGKDSAVRRLDDFFAYADLVKDPAGAVRSHWVVGAYAYYNQFRYNPNNEPDLHAPWMYTLIGAPWKTSAVLRAAQTLFVNGPSGVTGNDDLGTMSAWYLFSALGMYPAVPGTGQFLLHAPRFARAVIHLENGGEIVLSAPGADPSVLQYVKSVTVGGKPWDRVWVDHVWLTAGETITFELTADPDEADWGTGPFATPPSPCG
jgi:predicted alpha-1,2-mannosidase